MPDEKGKNIIVKEVTNGFDYESKDVPELPFWEDWEEESIE